MNAAATDGAGAGKREAILDAARKVFLDVGFGAASMDAIANEAQVSKQTVYNHFGSKEDLFAAMVRNTCESMTLAFAEAARDGNPEKTLRAIAQRFMAMACADDKLALHRTLMAEVPRFPELGRIFYQSGPAVIHQFLSDYFTEQNQRGALKVDNPQVTAEQFINMVTSCRLRAELGVEPVPSATVRDQYINNAVMLIMRACKP